jgi:hypothetical protein
MASKEQNDQGKRPREIIISGKKAKKSAIGRRVPK